jgi:serine/threonine-protein kinase
MSRVFLAREITLERYVVVKVLPSEMAAEVSAERFRREISLAARLQHPHIVPLLAAGPTAVNVKSSNLPYFTMPYVEGESLRTRLTRGGAFEVGEAIRLLREVASALGYAHARGIVHRDIKPENILVTAQHALVTDFGVAKALSLATTRGDGITSIGVALGTPAYMSPEQAAADPNADHRSDIYSFGIVAYELLSGHPPFVNRPPQALIAAHITEQPAPLDRVKEMPRRLTELVMRCLEKDPSRRPETASEIIRQLDAIVMGPGTRDSRPSVAVLPLVNTSNDVENEHFSDGLTDELIAALSKVPDLTVSGRTSVFALKGKGMSTRAVADTLRVANLVEGSVRRAGDRLKVSVQLVDTDGAVLWSESYDRRLTDVFAVQEEIAQAVVKALSIKLAPARGPLVRPATGNVVAHDVYLKGKFVLRRFHPDDIRQAIGFFEQAVALDPSYASAYASLADAHALLVVFASVRAEQQVALARSYSERSIALDNRLADGHWARAHVAFALEFDWELAGREFKRAIELEPGHADVRHMHAIYLLDLERFDEAIEELRFALGSDPLLAPASMTLGRVYMAMGRPLDAVPTLLEALELSPHFTYAREQLTHAYLALDRIAEAVAEAERGTVRGGARESAVLAYALGIAGRHDDARRIIRDVLAHDDRYVAPFHVAMAHVGIGDVEAAFAWLDRACDDHDPHVTGLRIAPAFQPLRSDARFAKLLLRLGVIATASG